MLYLIFIVGQFTHHKYQINRLHKAITYLTFSPNGQELLVNMGSDQIYIYNMDTAIKPVVSNHIRLIIEII